MENGPVLASERSNNSLARQFNKSRSLRAMGRAVLNDFSQAKARQKWREQPFQEIRLRSQGAMLVTNSTHSACLSMMREHQILLLLFCGRLHDAEVSNANSAHNQSDAASATSSKPEARVGNRQHSITTASVIGRDNWT